MKFIVFLFIFLNVFSICHTQSKWMRIYHDDIDAPMKFILESYDNGYLLTGKHGANYSKYNWLIKTDINGELLWEKTFGNGITSIVLPQIAMINGNIYLCGGSRHEDPYGDPIIIKLNTCGEKQWCKILHSPNHNDAAHCICITPDGGCAVTLNDTGTLPWEDRICLAKFSPDGNMEWKQCYNSQDSLLGNEQDENLILTPDKGFLITGWCYYTDPTGSNAWPEPYFIKTDSLGNFEWETVLLSNIGDEGGQGWQTVINQDSIFFFSSISHYYFEDNTSSPALVKMDFEGNLIDIFNLKEPSEIGKLFDAKFINDSLLAASAIWGIDSLNSPMAVIIDTLGNIQDSMGLLINDYMSYVRPVYDDKLLFYTQTYHNGEFDIYLFKLNAYLDSDTLYSYPFIYDSLCPYQIVSDTIGFDNCDLIVGIEDEQEKGRRGEVERMIELWPNPCSTVLSVSLASRQSSACPEERSEFGIVSRQSIESLTIQIYDVYGRLVKEELQSPYFNDGENEANWKIDVSNLPIGLYLVTVKDGQKVKVSGKFLVAR